MREGADWLILYDARMVEYFLKLGCGSAAFKRCQINFTTQINRIESDADALTGRTEVMPSSRDKRFASNRQIPVGALIGKIGSGDEYIKLGSHATITAQKSGQLQLAIAMRPEQAGNEFPGSYKVKIRVTRKP